MTSPSNGLAPATERFCVMPLTESDQNRIAWRIVRRLGVVIVVSGSLGLIAWCGLDYLYVRVESWRTHKYDGLLLLFPVSVALISFAVLPRMQTGRRFGLAAVAGFFASVLAVILIGKFGMPFHFAIGGQK